MDVIFTSCATESNNAAIAAALKANPTKRHIVTSSVEHSSVLNYCMALEKAGYLSPLLDEEGCRGGRPKEDGYRVTYLPVDRDGLSLSCWFNQPLATALEGWASRETGVLFPVEQIAEV